MFTAWLEHVLLGRWMKVGEQRGRAVVTSEHNRQGIFVGALSIVKVTIATKVPGAGGSGTLSYGCYSACITRVPESGTIAGAIGIGPLAKTVGGNSFVTFRMPSGFAQVTLDPFLTGDAGLDDQTEVPKSGDPGGIIPDALKSGTAVFSVYRSI